jgi:histidine kinase family protein
MQMLQKLSIKAKIALAVVGCLAAIAATNAALARFNYQQDIKYAAEQSVQSAARSFTGMERREVDKLSTALDALLGEPAYADFFSLRERDRLYETAAPVFRDLKRRHGITHWYFIDPAPSRTCFLRVHRPELRDDVVNRATLLAAIRTNDTASGKELGQTAFALRVVRPFVSQDKILGYMELGEEIDDFLTRMKTETGDDYGLVVEKRYLDERAYASVRGDRRNNWGDDPEVVVIDVTDPASAAVGSSADVRDVPEAGRVLEPLERGARLFVRGVVPVLDAAGQRVGGLFVLHDVTALRDRARSEQVRVVVMIGMVALVVLGLLYVLFERLVFRRLDRMTSAMENVSTRLAGGDYNVGGTVRPAGTDEIGRFEGFLGSFLTTIGATLRDLEKRGRRSG